MEMENGIAIIIIMLFPACALYVLLYVNMKDDRAEIRESLNEAMKDVERAENEYLNISSENAALHRKLGRCRVYLELGHSKALESELQVIPVDWIPDFMKPYPEAPDAV